MTTNPYEVTHVSGSPFDPPEPAVNKPVSITIFGILNLVFAIMGLAGAVMGLGFMLYVFSASGQEELRERLWNDGGPQAAFMVASAFFGFISKIVQLFAGIGLLRGRKSGRTLSIIYAWYAIIITVVGALINYFMVLSPVMEQMQQPKTIGSSGSLVFGGVMVISTAASLIYPMLLLVFMYRRNVAAALK